jgi:DNA invertase Pin-like site-specific DNA recombinase
MKAIGYIRVSTEEQAKHGVSLDMQRSKIAAYADLEDMNLVDIIADEGISGCNIKGRPGIQRALAMVKSGQVKAVIVYKLDRLARNTIEALQVAKLMDRNGVALHSITEKLDTKSAMGRFFFTLMASIAEMERGIISERISAAMSRKREKKEPCSNNPPFGYQIVENRLVPDIQENKVINRIAELRRAGHTVWGIREILEKEGLLNRRGNPYGKTQIHSLIMREAS